MPPYAGQNPANDPNPFLRPNDNDFILLSPNRDADAHRWVYSAYAETLLPFVTPRNDVPFARSLDVSLAARIEHFPYFGNATKPKASLGYVPFRWLKIRGSVNESFKAPNIVQTNTPRRQVFATGITDPYRFEVTGLLTDGSTGRTVFRQGSRDLNPEETITYTAGFILDVPKIKGLSITVDFYKINQNNVITSADGTYQLRRDEELLDIEVQRQLAAGTPIGSINLGSGTSAYKGNPKVNRATVTPGDAALYSTFNATRPSSSHRAPVGPVINMTEDFVNLAGRDLDGIEYGLEYRLPRLGDIGDITFRGEASFRHKFELQEEPGLAIGDDLYEDGRPKWRYNLSARWRRGNWNAGWFMSYYGKFVDTGAATTSAVFNALGRPDYINPFNNSGAFRYVLEVEPAIAHNVNIGYRFTRNSGIRALRNLGIRAGINNVFDEPPPISDSTFGYESGAANPRGRQYWIEVSKAW
jgi:iron complex outermembrane recepter protein